MEGVVKSYVAEKRFGFIDGADKKSYFFHINDFSAKPETGSVPDGALVIFDPAPTPKGLAAKRLKLASKQAIEWVAPSDFLMLREDEPKRGRLVSDVSAVTVTGRGSPEELRWQLRRIATKIGGNAIVGMTYRKSTGSEGNYQFTVHNISGRPALIMEGRMTTDLTAVERSERNCEMMAAALEQGHNVYLDNLAELEKKRRQCAVRNSVIILILVFGWPIYIVLKTFH